jgi:hypothetical protein
MIVDLRLNCRERSKSHCVWLLLLIFLLHLTKDSALYIMGLSESILNHFRVSLIISVSHLTVLSSDQCPF